MNKKLKKDISDLLEETENAILFIDLCDSTELKTKLSPLSWITCINMFLTKISLGVRKYGGEVVKTIGDEVMATFKNQADVIKFIINFQETLNEISNEFSKHGAVALCKIACDYGPMYHYGEKDYISLTIDRCARIAKLCPKDSVLFSEPMYNAFESNKHLKGKIFIELHPNIKLKGIKEPINIYRLFPDQKVAKEHSCIIGDNIKDRDHKLLACAYHQNNELITQFYKISQEIREKRHTPETIKNEVLNIFQKTIVSMKKHLETYIEGDTKVNICIKELVKNNPYSYETTKTRSIVCTNKNHDGYQEYTIIDNTDFDSVFKKALGKKTGVEIFYSPDLSSIEGYCNTDKKWRVKYDSVIVAPISYNTVDATNLVPIYGFLCVDTLNNNSFKNNIQTIKDFVAIIAKNILYIMEKHEYFKGALNEKKC